MKHIKFAVLSLLALVTWSNAAIAQTIAPQPCDSRYWQQLEAKAVLEAEREIMQNQNLIFKADSVMEYTCFDRLLAHTALHGGNIFSHTSYFGSPIIPPNSSLGLTAAMGNLVFDALRIYIGSASSPPGTSGNFNHAYLGGRAALMGASPSDTNMNTAGAGGPGGSLYSGSYGTCAMMAGVWRASKCMNFIDNANFQDTDGFYPLFEIRGHNGSPTIVDYVIDNRNTRAYPRACTGAVTMNTLTWGSTYLDASNGNNHLYPFQAPNRAIFLDVGNRTRPGNCASPAISTGITVIDGSGGTYTDGVCSNPGCTYDRAGSCS